jgi:hypothetical protein
VDAASVPAVAGSDEAPLIGFTMASPVSNVTLAGRQETLPMPPSLPDRLARCEKHAGRALLLEVDQPARRRGDVRGSESGELP